MSESRVIPLDEIQTRRDRAAQAGDAAEMHACAKAYAEHDTPDAQLRSLITGGTAFEMQGEHERFFERMHAALDLAMTENVRDAQAHIHGQLANMYRNLGEYPKAFEEYAIAIDLEDQLGNKGGWAANTANLASLLLYSGDYAGALANYHKALDVQRELGQRQNIAVVTGNIGNIHSALREYDAALDHYHRALAEHEEMGDRLGMVRVLANIGKALSASGDRVEARAYFDRSLALLHDDDDDAHRQETILDKIYTYMRTDDYDTARALLATLGDAPIVEPKIEITRTRVRAELLLHAGDVQGARDLLLPLIDYARSKQQLKSLEAIHEDLMYVAVQAKDLDAYIAHDNAKDAIREQLTGMEAKRKLLLEEKQQEIAEREHEIQQERERERALLYGALPRSVADRMLAGDDVKADDFEMVSVLFMDIVGFTSRSSNLSAREVVTMLEEIFTICDDISQQHGLTKIKTIGDCYMAIAGIPEPLTDPVERAARAALQLSQEMKKIDLNVRIGLNCGPVVAGVIGTERLQYDAWGDTVNVASRMESTGEAGKIQVSSEFHEHLSSRAGSLARARDDNDTLVIPSANEEPLNGRTVERGTIQVKGKGNMTTYWLE